MTAQIVAGVVVFAVGVTLGIFTTVAIHSYARRPTTKPMDLDQLAIRFEEY